MTSAKQGEKNFALKGIRSEVERPYADLDGMCRLCGERGRAFMTNIFDDNLEVLENINMVVPAMVVKQFDKLPKKICSTCCNRLKVATDLIKKAYATDTRLRQIAELNDPEATKSFLPINGPATCDLCKLRFSNMKQFDRHIENHKLKGMDSTNDDSFKPNLIQVCGDCGFSYDKNEIYLKHKLMNEQVCLKCDMEVKSQCSLYSHICKINVAKPTTITTRKDLCLTNRSISITRQLKDKNLPKMKKMVPTWQCRVCDKVVTTKVSLSAHERIHSGAKPYICEHCGNHFRSRSNLMQHQLIHGGPKNYSCHICGKKFARKSFVRTHIRVHTGEKPYSCDVCGYSFSQIGDMRRHKKRHYITLSRDPRQIVEVTASQND